MLKSLVGLTRCSVGSVHFLASWHKMRQSSFNVIRFSFAYVSVFINCCLRFWCCHLVVHLVIFGSASTIRVIGWEDRLWTNLHCVEWDAKHHCTVALC